MYLISGVFTVFPSQKGMYGVVFSHWLLLVQTMVGCAACCVVVVSWGIVIGGWVVVVGVGMVVVVIDGGHSVGSALKVPSAHWYCVLTCGVWFSTM